MIKRQGRSFSLALMVCAAILGTALATNTQAQEVTYYHNGPHWQHHSPVQYQRVYQGTTWHWRPLHGWCRHDHYVNVPLWIPKYHASSYGSYVQVPTYFAR